MPEPVERFKRFLETRGLRFSNSHERVVQRVLAHQSIFRVGDLYEQLQDEHPMMHWDWRWNRIHRPTVHRIIHELREAGLIEVVNPDGAYRLKLN